MPRITVMPNYGPAIDLGSAFQQGLQGYMLGSQMKRQKLYDQQAAEDRQTQKALQDYDLRQKGIHILKPGEIPFDEMRNVASEAPVTMPQPPQLNFNPQSGSLESRSATTAAPVASDTRPGMPTSPFMQMVLGSMGSQPTPEPHYTFGNGYVVDNQQRAETAARESNLAAHSEFQKALMGALPGMMTEDMKRGRITANLGAAGVPANLVGAAADNPTLAADLLKPSTGSASKDEKIRSRITELVGKGMKLADANAQARLEFGEAPATPGEDRSLTLVEDPANPKGPGVYVPRAQAVGKHAPAGAGSGMITGLGSGGIVGVGRAIASVKSMHLADQQMKAFENDPQATAHYGAAKAFEQSLASHFDAHGMIDEGTMSSALSDLNKNDPGLANYMQNAYLWALEEANLSGRPSDFRTRLDHFVSSLKPNMGPQARASMQAGRTERLNGYDETMPALSAVLDKIAGGSGQATAPKASRPAGKSVPTATFTPSDTAQNPFLKLPKAKP